MTCWLPKTNDRLDVCISSITDSTPYFGSILYISNLHEWLHEGRGDPDAAEQVLAEGAQVGAAHLVGQVEGADHLDQLMVEIQWGREISRQQFQ